MRLIVIMGVAGCGKSTIGEKLAQAIDGEFLDADAYHPKSNIEKMSRGEALNDNDRWPWLVKFGREIAARKGLVVGGCSALKETYRRAIIKAAGEPVIFVHLQGTRELINERMKHRKGHFMPTSLLDSQFETLEIPGSNESAISVNIDASEAETVQNIRARLQAQLY